MSRLLVVVAILLYLSLSFGNCGYVAVGASNKVAVGANTEVTVHGVGGITRRENGSALTTGPTA